jgi:hypothetical protein
MFSCWNNNQYNNELIITHSNKIKSVELADYILKCQEKADNYDVMNDIILDLMTRLKKCKENSKDWEKIAKELSD